MSDQARDDLVAAMEALDRARNATGHYFQVEALPEVQAAALSLLRDHGKHLLALLDAEPVAGPAGCVCWQSSEWLIPPEKILPACDSFHKGKDGLCGVCDHAEACHARPEASDE